MEELLWGYTTTLKGEVSTASNAMTICEEPVEHVVNGRVVRYDLPYPTEAELADDNGCAAFLAQSTTDP